MSNPVIYNQSLEKHVIAGCLRHPKLFFEIEPFVSENDFVYDIYKTIFSVVKDQIHKSESIDPFILTEKIKNLGITFRTEANVFDLLTSLSLVKLSERAFMESCKSLKTTSIRRELFDTATKIQEAMKANPDAPYDKLVAMSDQIYNEKVNTFELAEEPQNLFDGMQEIIEEIGNNPVEDAGLVTPYKDFNRLYGGLRPKNLYAFTARAGQGKSTFLMDMAFKVCNTVPANIEKKIPCLYMDTEMEVLDQQKRLLASITGVPFWYIDTGNWRKNPEMVVKVRAAWPIIKKFRLHHIKVANKPTHEIISLARRWYYSKVGRGSEALFIYDYLKMTGESLSDAHKEYQVIGDKTDKLKKLSEELNSPFLTSTQLNRTGENQNRRAGAFTDDASAIALSDRLQWFASYVSIFRRKTLDEIELDGPENGTHKLVTTKSRFQGKEAAGHQDLVQREIDGERVLSPNYISFNVKNFAVEEIGSLDSLIERGALQLEVFDNEGRVINNGNGEANLL